jgi:protein-tyrosine phosphatase
MCIAAPETVDRGVIAWTPNLSWITPTLAVGGSFPAERTEELARAHRIAAVVDLRAEACDDEVLLRRHGVTFLHLPTLDAHAISPPMLRDGVAFVGRHLAAGVRVLIHCEHGAGRSALLALCVLVDRGHAPLDALALAKDGRAHVSPTPVQYEAWAAWLRARQATQRCDWEVPDFDAFRAIAYRALGG